MVKENRVFYGWWIVLAVTTMSCFTSANPFNIVLKQLMTEFSAGRGMVSLAPSMSGIAGAFAGLFIGRLLVNHSPRKFMLWGNIIGGISLLLISMTQSLWQVYILYFINGTVMSGAGALTIFTMLSKWFTKKFGTVTGLTMTGGAASSLLITPLIGIIAENIGWRATYVFAGLSLLVVNIPLIIFVLKDSPEMMGLHMDGEKTGNNAGEAVKVLTQKDSLPEEKKPDLSSQLRNPALWAIGVSFALIATGDCAVTAHEVSFMTDMNISATVAASALGFTLGISAVSRLGSGWLADRFSSRYIAIMFLLVEIAGMIILMRVQTITDIWWFVAVYGLGVGASTTLLPMVLRDIFGRTGFSMLFAVVDFFFRAGFTIGTPFAGFIFDATGSYSLVFTIVVLIYILAAVVLYFVFGVNPKPLRRALKT